MKTKHKLWLSPFVAVIFGAVAISGLLMLFHVRLPVLKQIHDWGGVAFMVAGTIHLIVNWRQFTAYFRNSTASVGVLAGVAVLILTVLVAPQDHESDFRRLEQHQNTAVHGIFRH